MLSTDLISLHSPCIFRRNEHKCREDQVRALKVALRFSKTNSIDIVVAAAGVSGLPFITQNDEIPTFDKDPAPPTRSAANFYVNTKGVYEITKLAQHSFAILRSSANQPDQHYRRSLVLISSLAGCLDLDGVDYAASKWAVRGLFGPKMQNLGY